MKKLVVLSLSLLSLTVNAISVDESANQSRWQRFKQSKFFPGGGKTRAVGSAIASPFNAIGRSVQNSYGTLKGKSSTLKKDVYPYPEDFLTKRPINHSDVTSKTEKAKIIALKGLAGAAAPFHAAGKAIGKGAKTAGDAIGSRAVTAGQAIGKIFKRNRHSNQHTLVGAGSYSPTERNMFSSSPTAASM